MRVLLLSLLFCIGANHCIAKADSLPQKRIEAFLNISNSLSRFTGNSQQNILLDAPYLVGVKLRNKKGTGAFRFGTDFNLLSNSGTTNGIFSDATEQYLSANLGYEWRRPTLGKFEVYYGVDLRYYQITRETVSTLFSQTGSPLTSEFYTRNNGPGAAAFLGFSFNLTPRISFFTEGSLAYFALNNFRSVKEINSPITQVLEDRIVHQFRPIAPNSIFFMYRF